jgi:hypothetical protein
MNADAFIKRIVASTFVLVGCISIVVYLWPEGITDMGLSAITIGLALRVIGAAVAAVVGAMVVWSFWAR